MKQPSAVAGDCRDLFCALELVLEAISRGQFSEAKRWSEAAIEQARQVGEAGPLGGILDAAGWISYMSGDPAKAHELLQMKVIDFLELRNRGGAASLSDSGLAKVTLGENLEAGLELISRSLELFRTSGDAYGAVVALITFGWARATATRRWPDKILSGSALTTGRSRGYLLARPSVAEPSISDCTRRLERGGQVGLQRLGHQQDQVRSTQQLPLSAGYS